VVLYPDIPCTDCGLGNVWTVEFLQRWETWTEASHQGGGDAHLVPGLKRVIITITISNMITANCVLMGPTGANVVAERRGALNEDATCRSQLDGLQRLRLPISLPNPVFPGTGSPAQLRSWTLLHSPLHTQTSVAGARAGLADGKSPVAPPAGKDADADGDSSDEEGMVKEDEDNPTSVSLGDGPPPTSNL
jgi:hypothetical protein